MPLTSYRAGRPHSTECPGSKCQLSQSREPVIWNALERRSILESRHWVLGGALGMRVGRGWWLTQGGNMCGLKEPNADAPVQSLGQRP